MVRLEPTFNAAPEALTLLYCIPLLVVFFCWDRKSKVGFWWHNMQYFGFCDMSQTWLVKVEPLEHLWDDFMVLEFGVPS